MIYFYIPFAALLVLLSFRSFRAGIEYLNYFRQELARPIAGYTPFTTIIAPCKGLDEHLRDNLSALLCQDHPAYEVLFVVDDRLDPAVEIIRDICDTDPSNRARLIIAPRSRDSGQKVENLRTAVLAVDERSEVFAFVDSDIRPAKDWLRSLIAPLADEKIGAATGYRWFASDRTNFATEVRAAWNASIASALGPDMRSNFCWGGSTAIRREVFERLGVANRWKGAVSDDFVLTRTLAAAGLPIKFVPNALVESNGRCTFRGLFEFTNRQMKITRVYADDLWLKSFVGSGLFNLVAAWSLLILVLDPIVSTGSLISMAALFFIASLSAAKAWLRFRAVRLVLSSNAVARQLIYQLTLWMLTPAVFLANCITALFSRTITWRGIEYKMLSPSETKVQRLTDD